MGRERAHRGEELLVVAAVDALHQLLGRRQVADRGDHVRIVDQLRRGVRPFIVAAA
jgi:hypothetical protein